jgi:hypothetical protein
MPMSAPATAFKQAIPFRLGAVQAQSTQETERVQPVKEFFGYFLAPQKVT